jgi:serine/threonine-protein kinase
VLPPAVASDPDRLARFTREAMAMASLNHPNIAAVYGVEEHAIVMELVEGQPPAGPLSPEAALPLIRQLIDALEYAHEKGVVHRDLKPASDYLVASATPNRLCLRSLAPRICSYSVDLRPVPRPRRV